MQQLPTLELGARVNNDHRELGPIFHHCLEEVVEDQALADDHDRFVLLLAEKLLAQVYHLLLSEDDLLLDVGLDELGDFNPDFVHRASFLREQVLEMVPDLFDCVLDASGQRERCFNEIDDVIPFARQLTTQALTIVGLEVLKESRQSGQSYHTDLVGGREGIRGQLVCELHDLGVEGFLFETLSDKRLERLLSQGQG